MIQKCDVTHNSINGVKKNPIKADVWDSARKGILLKKAVNGLIVPGLLPNKFEGAKLPGGFIAQHPHPQEKAREGGRHRQTSTGGGPSGTSATALPSTSHADREGAA